MILLPPSTRIFLACGTTDMRKGFDGLAVMTQQVLEQSEIREGRVHLVAHLLAAPVCLEEAALHKLPRLGTRLRQGDLRALCRLRCSEREVRVKEEQAKKLEP